MFVCEIERCESSFVPGPASSRFMSCVFSWRFIVYIFRVFVCVCVCVCVCDHKYTITGTLPLFSLNET